MIRIVKLCSIFKSRLAINFHGLLLGEGRLGVYVLGSWELCCGHASTRFEAQRLVLIGYFVLFR